MMTYKAKGEYIEALSGKIYLRLLKWLRSVDYVIELYIRLTELFSL